MSMMGTLAKMAVGVAVAKGASAIIKSQTSNRSSNDLGDMLGGLMGGGSSSRNSSDIGNMLGGLLGGQKPQSSGGLGDMLGGLMGQNSQQSAQNTGGFGNVLGALGGGGGLGSVLDNLGGSSSRSSGGLDSMLGGLAGTVQDNMGGIAAAAGGAAGLAGIASMLGKKGQNENSGFGNLLNQALAQNGEPEEEPNADQEALAALMILSMISAAKADGEIDPQELEIVTKNLGDIDPEEEAFIRQAVQSNVSAQDIAAQTPKGMEQQVYMMSLLAITLDHDREAQYLHNLASALSLNADRVNAIHDQVQAPRIYN